MSEAQRQELIDVMVRLDGVCDLSQTDESQEFILRDCIRQIESVLNGGVK